MDGVCSGLARGPHVLVGVEVARDLDDLVGDAGMQRACVVGSGDRDGLDPELPAGAEDPDGDLAAVRDEQPANWPPAHMRKIPNFVSGIGASSAAEIPRASTRRVSSGSMIPSSQSRAVE